MTKKEVARQMRGLLTRVIRNLPDDVEYKCVGMHEDYTTKRERDHEEQGAYDDLGDLHIVEFTVEEDPGMQK